jgi:hypothetical protein
LRSGPAGAAWGGRCCASITPDRGMLILRYEETLKQIVRSIGLV